MPSAVVCLGISDGAVAARDAALIKEPAAPLLH